MVIVVIFAVTALSWVLGVGFLLGYYTSVEKAPGLKDESDKLRSVIDALSTELKNMTASLSAAQEENTHLDKRVAALTRHYLDQTDRMRIAEQRRNDAEMYLRKLEQQVVPLKPQDRHGVTIKRGATLGT